MAWIRSNDDFIEYVNDLDQNELTNWIERSLGGKSWPVLLGEDDLYQRFLDCKDHLGVDQLQRVRESIEYLFNNYSELVHSYDYVYRLIYFAGIFSIGSIKNILLHWLDKKLFYKKSFHSSKPIAYNDLHLTCLQVAASLYGNNDDKIIDICERDISENSYFPICFRILWDIDSSYIGNYFPNFIEKCFKGHFDPVFQLRQLINQRAPYIRSNFEDLFVTRLDTLNSIYAIANALLASNGIDDTISTHLSECWWCDAGRLFDYDSREIQLVDLQSELSLVQFKRNCMVNAFRHFGNRADQEKVVILAMLGMSPYKYLSQLDNILIQDNVFAKLDSLRAISNDFLTNRTAQIYSLLDVG